MSLFDSLVNRLYLRSTLHSRQAEPCPHSFFFVIDTLMYRQRVELPDEEEEDSINSEGDGNSNEERTHSKENEHDVPIQPAHMLVFRLLAPILHIVQTTGMQCSSPSSSPITALYRIPNDKNTHYFGDTPRPPRREPYFHSDVTLWHLY